MKLLRLLSVVFYIFFVASLFSAHTQRKVVAMGEKSKFVFAELKYRGGDWSVRSHSGKRLVWELIKQTGVEAHLGPVTVYPASNEIFRYPFIYMAGDSEFRPFNDVEIDNLRRFLTFGGTILIDNCKGKHGIGFDKSVRRAINRLLPDRKVVIMPDNHTISRSFFLIKHYAGRIAEYPYLEGVTIDGRTAIIYSRNDLGGAWAKDNIGNWEYAVFPGGKKQRRNAFHLGINIIMYALTGDYKQDQVHIPFILRRQK